MALYDNGCHVAYIFSVYDLPMSVHCDLGTAVFDAFMGEMFLKHIHKLRSLNSYG